MHVTSRGKVCCPHQHDWQIPNMQLLKEAQASIKCNHLQAHALVNEKLSVENAWASNGADWYDST